MRIKMLPSATVPIACHQFIPRVMSPAATRYVGIWLLMPTQRVMKLWVFQVLPSGGTGARSSLKRTLFFAAGPPATVGSTAVSWATSVLILDSGDHGDGAATGGPLVLRAPRGGDPGGAPPRGGYPPPHAPGGAPAGCCRGV